MGTNFKSIHEKERTTNTRTMRIASTQFSKIKLARKRGRRRIIAATKNSKQKIRVQQIPRGRGGRGMAERERERKTIAPATTGS
jgi:hypothetical protein